MGYVLPISHYQYNDYKNRVIQDKLDPFYIESPYKIILPSRYQDILHEQPQQSSINTKHHHPKHDEVEKVYANLTGKGQYFSERV